MSGLQSQCFSPGSHLVVVEAALVTPMMTNRGRKHRQRGSSRLWRTIEEERRREKGEKSKGPMFVTLSDVPLATSRSVCNKQVAAAVNLRRNPRAVGT